jgi:hypothetical protein
MPVYVPQDPAQNGSESSSLRNRRDSIFLDPCDSVLCRRRAWSEDALLHANVVEGVHGGIWYCRGIGSQC